MANSEAAPTVLRASQTVLDSAQALHEAASARRADDEGAMKGLQEGGVAEIHSLVNAVQHNGRYRLF